MMVIDERDEPKWGTEKPRSEPGDSIEGGIIGVVARPVAPTAASRSGLATCAATIEKNASSEPVESWDTGRH
jgi:hypothetical protein